MRLKGLRLSGFKSFANRTEFSFPEGVTCIVGPNGCGKSNVVDAVKWVLGEQRPTALRGAEMSDVIFGGTATRKPLGLAEVSLIVDNSDGSLPVDFAEVEVTRRLYRDGNSEYLMNRSKCRLRDLRELLMDTGSGPGALTFMEQGRIDRILRDNVQERRAVFEEAAGIAKYKARRKECLRRLERVEGDLLRISDIVEEKTRLVRSLKVQAGRAERYKALVDEMRGKRLQLAVHRYGLLLTEREAAHARVLTLTDQEATARAQLHEALGSAREAEVDLERARTRAAEVENEITALEGREETAREKSTFAARLSSELEGRIRWYGSEIEGGAERLAELAELRGSVGADLRSAEEDRDERFAAVREAETAVGVARKQGDELRVAARAAADRFFDGLGRISRLENQRSKFEAQAQSLEGRGTRLRERLAELAALRLVAEDNAQAAEDAANQARAAAEAAARRLDDAEARVHELEGQAATLGETVSALDRDVSGTRSRVDVLRSLAERMDGVGEGAKRLLAAIRKGKMSGDGVRGVLAELLRADANSAAAVETALGDLASAIVVDTFEQAAAAVAYVRENKLGRCVFLPLDTMSVVELPAPPAGLRSLLEGVRCDDAVRPALQALLSDAVVVADLDAARVARAQGAARLVTSDGAVLETSGAVAAGGVPGGAGLLQRGAELRELVARLEKVTAELNASRAQLATLREALTEAREEARAARTARREADAEQHRRTAHVERARADVERAGVDRRRLDSELGEIDEGLTRCARESADAESSIVRERAEQTDRERRRDEAQAGHTAHDEQVRELESQRADLRVELASVSERCSSLAARSREVEREAEEVESGVVEARKEMAGAETRRAEAQKRGAEARADHAKAQTRREQCVRQLVELRHDLSQAQQQLEERRALHTALDKQAGEVSRELQRFRLRHNEARVRVEGLVERIQEELEIDLGEAWASAQTARVEEAAPLAPPAEPGRDGTPVYGEAPAAAGPQPEVFDAEALDAEISELKIKIGRMGAVNLEALEQLESAETEASELQQQHDDLTKSRVSLMEAIRKIDAESRKLFTETFEAIRTNFREMFRRLFGGGKADIVLEEGADILEAGVDIVARPPGKEQRSITLLSGGERTMTAVALMFSIYLAKPSPFCLLDEVDAALDESNIDRFVAVLSEFSQTSQFIIVTHNKRTMGVADTIFGVSMPEPGVSRKLAVRVEDVADDGQFRAAG